MNIETTHLGKDSAYPQRYDPSALVAVPRNLNREQLGITGSELPFYGADVWHAYEFSFLTPKGLPVNGILKIVYPANNEFLVESKSLKLYLNSFNMERMGETRSGSISLSVETIRNDLKRMLGCEVGVSFFDHTAERYPSDFDDYPILEQIVDVDNLRCEHYTENPDLLLPTTRGGEIRWGSHLLRSNCKITSQPDWGSVFVKMIADNLPTPESFLKYIVSLRNENHFHEEICETIFKRLNDRFHPSQLMVSCLYTRRGGIDICPIRNLPGTNLPDRLVSGKILTRPIFRQ